MAFRFQKRIKIAPWITINLSKSGVSTSIGPRGARISVGRGKTRTTVGLPGSGLSHTTIHKSDSDTRDDDETSFSSLIVGFVILVIILLILF